MAAAALLELQGVQAGYAGARLLHGVDLRLAPGESLAVLGRNGVGKTTLVETVMGLTEHQGGSIRLDGQPIESLPPQRRNHRGVAWVPQMREVFGSLTVRENLWVTQRRGDWTAERVFELFPRLQERQQQHADQLSGGEQQMLAMARALVTNPRLLLLDEPVEGLAPLVVVEMFRAIARMRSEGKLAIVLVEQKHDLALAHTDRCIVLDHGAVVHEGPSAQLLAQPQRIEQLVGLAQGDRT